jgi:flagellar rod assembly protein/muramidase FlgJ
MKTSDFITQMAPGAQASMRMTKVPASFTIAQAALESGWGSSALAVQAMNLFGVKADKAWHGATVSMPTNEFINGKKVMVSALWRKYASWDECLSDHARFLVVNRRYAPAFQHCDNAEAFALAIAAAGYATDPQYAAKVIAVIRSNHLTTFDQSQEKH